MKEKLIMDFTDLKRQHNEVMNIANYILENIKNCTVDENINEVVKNINIISGKLKIHMVNEDKHLYPYLLNSSDPLLNTFGKKYGEEMEGVSKVYEEYKSKYNTATKIKQNMDGFNTATKQTFVALSNRIYKEEKELFVLLK
jgi:hypothetical protein